MQKIYYYLILVSLTAGLSFCKKETKPVEYSGVVFHPTKADINPYEYSGLSVNGTKISFANGLVSSSNFLTGGLYQYNINDQSIINTPIEYDDTAKIINGLININQNKYLGFNIDPQIKTTTNEDTVDALTVLLLDGNFKLLKEKIIDEGTLFRLLYKKGIHLKLLNNGDFIICTATGRFYSKNYLICLDENLNIKWKVNVENTPNFSDDYLVQNILVKDNSIYLLQNKISGTYFKFDNYRIKKYDYNGNFVNASVNSASGFEGSAIIPSENGYIIVGSNFNASTDYTTFFSSYDMNNNLITTKTLGKVKYSKFYPIKYNSPVVSSNIIQCNNAYYFTTLEYQLVKVNKSFEVEWAKSIDKFSPFFETLERGLVNVDDHIFCTGKNNWTGVDGITFIKTDFDGNLVK